MNILKTQNKTVKLLLSYLLLAFGAIMSAAALEFFLIPNSILDGGVTGISMIISRITPLSLSLLVILINIPFVLIGFKRIGLRFLLRTIYAIAIFSLALSSFKGLGAATSQIILAISFGGILLGAGVGIVMRAGGCIDGTESVALVISKNTSLSTGQIVLFFNLLIYGASVYFFGLDRAMYSLLTYFITFKVIDFVAEGMEQAKAALIVTDKGDILSETIAKRLGRSLTLLEGEGMVSGKKNVLYCVLTRIEVFELKNIIEEIDENAFISILEVSEVIGLFHANPKKQNKYKEIKNS